MVANTTLDLEKRIEEIDKKLEALPLRDLALHDEFAVERQQIEDERDSTEENLNICAQVSTQAHEARSNIFDDISVAEGGIQEVIITTGDLISAQRVTAGERSIALLGQISDATLADLVSLHATDVSSTSRLGEHSSASSVTSFADSVFSNTSRSSKSSVVGPAGAGERLIALLRSDNQLSLLFQEALERVSANKFERNLLRILNKFASELRKEAENPQQRSIAKFVRSRARNSAHVILNSICSPEKAREDTIPKSMVLHEPIDSDSDESGDDSGPDHEDNTDLQQLEDFIITSQAFIKLRQNLSSFLYPIDEGKVENKGTPVYERSSCSYITRFVAHFRNFWEPRLQQGKHRIRWKCVSPSQVLGDIPLT